MSTRSHGRARRRAVRTGAAGRRRGQDDGLIARRRTMPPPLNLPEMHLLGRLSLLLVEPASPALN